MIHALELRTILRLNIYVFLSLVFLSGSLTLAQVSDGTAQPFTISVSDEVLTDLNARLAETRWPDQVEGADWAYGTNLDYLQELVTYWQDEFDWRAQEERLNSFDNFTADVELTCM